MKRLIEYTKGFVFVSSIFILGAIGEYMFSPVKSACTFFRPEAVETVVDDLDDIRSHKRQKLNNLEFDVDDFMIMNKGDKTIGRGKFYDGSVYEAEIIKQPNDTHSPNGRSIRSKITIYKVMKDSEDLARK